MKRRIATIVCAVAVMLIVCPALSAQVSEKDHIEVVGRAEKKVKPDEIILNIVIDESDIQRNRTLNNLEKKIVDKLKQLDIDVQKDFVVNDLSSNLQKYLLKKDDNLMRKEYELTTSSAQQAAQVMIALGEMGVSKITVSSVNCSNIEEQRREVNIMAIQNAKMRATELTAAIGQEIGKAIYIYEVEYGYARQNTRMMKNALVLEESALEDTYISNLDFEDIIIEGRVNVRFELK